MVTRKLLFATLGWRSTASSAHSSSPGRERQRALGVRRGARGVAQHLRRLTEQHVERQVDRAAAEQRVPSTRSRASVAAPSTA
jgi:hypothetical protein